MSNLPRDLTEEVLCRVPFICLRIVRATCKKWNTLSKDLSFVKKHVACQAKSAAVVASVREFMVVVMMDYRVYLMSIHLHNDDVESCIKPQGKLICLDDEVDDISQVFHCDGLLLCITKYNIRLTVWNPYWGIIRQIEPTHNFHILERYSYALGYDKSSKSYKILMFVDFVYPEIDFKIYEFNSNSWRVLDVTHQDWSISELNLGVSLKGNTYWFASEMYSETSETYDDFLVCFDFTSETFGPRLPLPVYEYPYNVSLSIVREEQLALLYQPWDDTSHIEIWITTKIEPNTASWNSKVFLTANIQQLIHPQFQFTNASFFIHEEKKVAVVFDKGKLKNCFNTRYNRAYIFGVDGSLKEVDLVECANSMCYPRVCSYVPSSVQLN
ncbi:F-box protein [Cardamine amara subsp. amara]|uniref:F-box protein n=1 Tax=Cardamine amara subsp. amara TaxID=228776 RepID=A0ABD1BLC4_CARAN